MAVLLGGHSFDVVLYEWFYYEEHLWQLPRVWEGGMATHGVLLGAVLATVLFCRLRNKSFFEIADEVVVPATVLMALGRVGNHINGEVYGSITDVGWAMESPYAAGCRHPVALYDGIKNLAILPVLLYVRGRYLGRGLGGPSGLVLGHFVLWYGSLRLLVDHFREYDSYWLGVGRGQYFNLLMAAIGLGIVLVARRLARPRPDAHAHIPSRQSLRGGRVSWVERSLFYALVVLCLTIPSGWTRQVLADSRCAPPRRPQRRAAAVGGKARPRLEARNRKQPLRRAVGVISLAKTTGEPLAAPATKVSERPSGAHS